MFYIKAFQYCFPITGLLRVYCKRIIGEVNYRRVFLFYAQDLLAFTQNKELYYKILFWDLVVYSLRIPTYMVLSRTEIIGSPPTGLICLCIVGRSARPSRPILSSADTSKWSKLREWLYNILETWEKWRHSLFPY